MTRTIRRSPILGAAALMLLLVPPRVSAGPQGEDQQLCIRTLGADAARVARLQARENVACVRAGARGAVADAQACLAADVAGRVAKARARTAADVSQRCQSAPAFGVAPRLAETANAAGTVHEIGLVGDVFGPDLQVASAVAAGNRAAARCQSAVAKDAEGLAAARVQAFLGCERAALRRGATSAADLAACVGQGAAVAVARATAKLGADVGARCAGVATDVVLPGACAGRTGAALASCVGERVACRVCRLLDSTGALDADCDAADDGLANQSCRMPVSVSGDAIPFNGGDGRVAGAEIWILEHPEMRVVTGADGHFRFDGLDEGSEVTLVLDHPDYHPIQTGTMRLGPLGAERVTFQAVVYPIYSALGALLNLVPDDEHACQMVTTLTRVGRSLYDPGAHGEADATVTLDPALPAEHGPIYFNALVLPDRSLTRSSDDGGALFVQVPPGEYVWTATKAGAAFSRIKMKCRVGLLVNASPPWGLQRQ